MRPTLLDEVLEAHGGVDRWRAERTIYARVRTGGLLVRTRVPGNRLADYRVTVGTDEPWTVLDPIPREGKRGVLERGAARIESAAGEVLATRADLPPQREDALGAPAREIGHERRAPMPGTRL
jgi:hypothetical protein